MEAYCGRDYSMIHNHNHCKVLRRSQESNLRLIHEHLVRLGYRPTFCHASPYTLNIVLILGMSTRKNDYFYFFLDNLFVRFVRL
jgi:hypothetical protein